ncbi:MAG: dTDP-4-dehydrorhamnose reductase [Lentisphaerae bacterium GWF2_52_8]|nr:MAG: dTDP-4-dehydrorhamnose reductase [Lentisphaerae bacterium GWF2_52_8]
MSTLAILGGRGMLGRELSTAALAAGWETAIYDLPEFDITSASDIETALNGVDAVVNCAAYTAVDLAESQREKCFAVNARALSLLGNAAAARGVYVLHIGTDFVFGDTLPAKPLSEKSKPSPLSVYGLSKWEGELMLYASGAKHAVVRVQWTYGRYGQNFITKIVAAARSKPSLKVSADQIGSPTHTADVARALLCLLKHQTQGLYHFAANGYTSRFEQAKLIISELGLPTIVEPCLTSDFPTPARRPLNSRFDCRKIDGLLDFKRPEWQDSLRGFLGDLGRQEV